MLDNEDVEATRYTAETRIRSSVDEMVTTLLVNESITTLDAIVYSSCGGDLQRLIAEAAIDSLCFSLGQNPVDLLESAIKNSKKTSEVSIDESGSTRTT